MVDTMTIRYNFDCRDEYISAVQQVKDYKHLKNNQQLHWNGICYETFGFADIGIERLRFKGNESIGKYTAEIKLRPKLMVTQDDDYNDLLYASDVSALFKTFSEFMNELGICVASDLCDWKIKRIDYAVDIAIEQVLIPKYIALFKKGNIKEELLMRDGSQKYFDKSNNLYLTGTSYRINFYDRWLTSRLKQKKRPNKFSDIDDRKGLLRIEVQLHKPNISKLRKSGYITKNSVEDFLNIDIAGKYILGKYKEIVGAGDYYSYKAARCKCKSSKQREILKLIHDTGSIYQAKREYINSKNDKRKAEKNFSSVIVKLHSLGVNPVTLDKGYSNKECLINPYSKIKHEIEASKLIHIKRRKDKII